VIKGASKKSRYIYGIINSDNNLSILNSANLSADNNAVYAVPYNNYAAIVSDSEIVDYVSRGREYLARLLVKHQEIIEKIMSLKFTVIPVKLGTWAADTVEVTDILKKGNVLFRNIMEKIKDKVEIDVAVTWSDFSATLKEIGEKEEIKALKASISDNSKEINTDDQIKLGMAVKKELDRITEEYALKIKDCFEEYWVSSKSHVLMDDKMILNAAFLINKNNQNDFDKRILDTDTKFDEKLNFRCVGPLPPYSFYTVEINNIKFEDLDWAGRKIGLPDNFVSRNEIVSLYKKLTLKLHPDKNTDNPSAESEFNEVIKAYRILNDYMEACSQESHKDIFSFDMEEYKRNSILISLRN